MRVRGRCPLTEREVINEEKSNSFAWWGGDERNAATQAVIEQFMALHPGVTIEGEPGSSDGYHDKLATQLASGTAPDIVQIDPETMPTFVDSGDYFVDLNTMGVDMSNFEDAYIRLRINGNYDGKQLGLPTGIAGPAILVNKGLMDEMGVDLTKQGITWDDFIEAGKAVQAKDPSVYLFCVNKDYIANLFVLTMAKQKAGRVFDDDGKLVITKEQLTEVFEYVKQLYDNDIAVAIGGTPNDKISSSQEAKTLIYDAVEAIGYGQSTPEQAAEDVFEQYQDLQK